jgi:hypothetical protein
MGLLNHIAKANHGHCASRLQAQITAQGAVYHMQGRDYLPILPIRPVRQYRR